MSNYSVTAKKLLENADLYFSSQEGGSVSVAGFCSALGISLDEWQELADKKSLKTAVRRIETKIRAMVENDHKRPATITSLLLKQLDGDDKPKIEFILRIDREKEVT